jgi:branched-chain amino acid transport system permease protein
MSGADFLNLLISALLLAGVYAAMSVGMTIIYGVMKIVNLAHAGILMLGAYFVYELYERLGIDPLLGVVLAFPVFFLLGIGLHRTLIQRLPVSDQPTLASLLLLFGLWLVIQNLGYLIWGNADRAILTPRTMSVLRLGAITIPTVRLAVFGGAVAALAALELVLHRTWFGRAVRALMQNRDAGRLVGIDVEGTARTAFGMGIAFAGAAGGMLAMLYSFAAGAVILALLETFSIQVLPASYQPAIAFSLLVVALAVLPGGLAGLWVKRRRWT